MSPSNIGTGLLWMDYSVISALWLAAGVSIFVSFRLHGRESQWAATFRWVFTMGISMLAAVLTLRLWQWGDLPMSPPFAAGFMLACSGYVGLALHKALVEKP